MPLILDHYADPSHGWLAAPRALLEELGLIERVSAYSYQYATRVFLEEDADAGLLIEALQKQGRQYVIRHNYTNRRSFIRCLPIFTANRS